MVIVAASILYKVMFTKTTHSSIKAKICINIGENTKQEMF